MVEQFCPAKTILDHGQNTRITLPDYIIVLYIIVDLHKFLRQFSS